MKINPFHTIGIAKISSDLRVLNVSPNFHAFLESGMPDPTGQPLTKLFEEFVGAEEILQKVLHGEMPEYHLELSCREQSAGVGQYMDFRVLPSLDDDSNPTLLLIIKDSSQEGLLERKLVQERNELRLMQAKLEELNRELEKLSQFRAQFLSMAAHDMGTPLNVIYGYIEWLLSDIGSSIPYRYKEIFSIIQYQVERMNVLLRDLRDYDQIDKGEFSVSLESCNLKEIVENIEHSLALVAQRKDISLHGYYPEEAVNIQADPKRVQQIIYNLITNAIKFSPRNSKIHLSVQKSGAGGIFQVKDFGPGIPEEDLENIFLANYRTTSAKEVAGIGLGLYISKILVEAMGGKIYVESEVGVGTLFTVLFPGTRRCSVK